MTPLLLPTRLFQQLWDGSWSLASRVLVGHYWARLPRTPTLAFSTTPLSFLFAQVAFSEQLTPINIWGCSAETNDCLIHENLVDWPSSLVCLNEWQSRALSVMRQCYCLGAWISFLSDSCWLEIPCPASCLEHACSFSSAGHQLSYLLSLCPPTGPRVSVPGAAILPASSLNFSLTGSHARSPVLYRNTMGAAAGVYSPPAVSLLLRQVLQTEDVFPAELPRKLFHPSNQHHFSFITFQTFNAGFRLLPVSLTAKRSCSDAPVLVSSYRV